MAIDRYVEDVSGKGRVVGYACVETMMVTSLRSMLCEGGPYVEAAAAPPQSFHAANAISIKAIGKEVSQDAQSASGVAA
jgi:hypothetical protein